jgi:hypothetical protein
MKGVYYTVGSLAPGSAVLLLVEMMGMLQKRETKNRRWTFSTRGSFLDTHFH